MKYQTSEKIIFSALIIIILLINIIFNFPNFANIKKVSGDLNSEAESLKKAFELKQNTSRAFEDFQKFKNQIPALDTLFLHQGEELIIIQDLEKLAKNNNLKQKMSLSESENNLNKKIYSLGLRIELVGAYPNILNYLNEINKFGYKLIINITELKNEAGELKLDLLASTYWLYAENKNP